ARLAAEEALTLARQSGDVGTQAAAVGELAMIESFSGDDAAALRMFAQASALARQAGAYRSLLFVAVNESHVLGGLGEHERAAHGPPRGTAGASGCGPARPAGRFRAISGAERVVARGGGAGPPDVMGRARALPPPRVNRAGLRLLAAAIALCRGDLADARA